MSEVTAQLNGLRIAPRKVRAVVNLIKGKNVIDAVSQLEFMIKKPTLGLIKLLNSAISNAENTFGMARDNLYVKNILVDEDMKLKRFRAKGFGRAALIQKKTSHIKIILDERVPGLKRSKPKVHEAAEKETEVKKDLHSGDDKRPASPAGRPEVKREIGSKGNVFTKLGKKVFMRKSV